MNDMSTFRAILKIGLESSNDAMVGLKKRDYPTNSYGYGWWEGRFSVYKELIELSKMISEEDDREANVDLEVSEREAIKEDLYHLLIKYNLTSEDMKIFAEWHEDVGTHGDNLEKYLQDMREVYIKRYSGKVKSMKVGDKVTYHAFQDVFKGEKGIVKKVVDDEYAFVVYSCGNDWDNYENYTASRTNINDLTMGWEAEGEGE